MLARILRSINDDAAGDWYLKVAENEDAEYNIRFDAAQMLRQVGEPEAALRVFTRLVAARPSLLASESTLSFLAEQGSSESNQGFLEQLEDIARCEAHLDYLRGLLHFYAGDKEKAAGILEPIEEGSCLSEREMDRVNDLLERAATPE